jgi:nucleotide-binding universal stress UspA family protein
MDDVYPQPGEPAAPFDRVVVGIDERRRGADAAALAQQLVAAGGTVILAHVRVHDPGGKGELPTMSRLEHRRALNLVATVLDDLALVGKLVCISARSVGKGLHQLAIAERADLVVVGSCRHAAFGRVAISEPTSRALSGAPGAIAIAPRGYAASPAPLSAIGVAYDATTDSRDALVVARALAHNHGATLSALQVVTSDDSPSALEQARARIAALGDVQPHAANGDPAEQLTRYTRELDLLVVGSRGEDLIGRMAHGSTARRLAATAHCPLLVLTHNAPTTAPNRFADRHPLTSSVAGG